MSSSWKLPSLSAKHWLRISAVVVILVAVLALVVGQSAIHPKVSRQQAIEAAMKWGGKTPYPRIEAKYMRYQDLFKADPELGWGRDGKTISFGSSQFQGSTEFLLRGHVASYPHRRLGESPS